MDFGYIVSRRDSCIKLSRMNHKAKWCFGWMLIACISIAIFFWGTWKPPRIFYTFFDGGPNLNNDTSYPFNASESQNDLTVVTAYFNLGTFKKGPNIFTHSLYRQWMTVFACISNRLIIYVDNEDDEAFFVSVRSRLPPNITKIIRLNRTELWSFGLEKRIRQIFEQPGYPKHHPNTVVPAYSAAMHAKYEAMQLAIRENPFRTRHFCWLDIGLFRGLTSSSSVKNPGIPYGRTFHMELPGGLSPDAVAYTEVKKRNGALSVRDIVFRNEYWLCGCYFVGEKSVLYRWTQEYQKATAEMLSKDLMSTDQQVIYAMFNTMQPKTKIQAYVGDGRFNEWFHLGYVSRKVT